MQEYLQRRQQELARLEAELEEARAALDTHDGAVRARAADLEALAAQLDEAEAQLQRDRADARARELALSTQAVQLEEGRRLAAQVRPACTLCRCLRRCLRCCARPWCLKRMPPPAGPRGGSVAAEGCGGAVGRAAGALAARGGA
jgi:hypothetical protein